MKQIEKKTKESDTFDTLAGVLEQGDKLKEDKDYPGLIKLLTTARIKWGENVPIEGMLGDAYIQAGDHHAAEKVFSELAKSDDAPYWVYVGYANVLEKQKNIEGAERYFCQALREEYSYELALRLAKLLKFSANPDTLYENIVNILESKFDVQLERAQEFYLIGSYLYARKDYKYAAELIEKSTELNEKNVRYQRRMIFAKIRCNDFSGARESIKQLEAMGGDADGRLANIISFYSDIHPYLDQLDSIFLPEYYRWLYSLEMLNNRQAYTHFLSIGVLRNYRPNPWLDINYFVKKYEKYFKESELPVLAYLRLEHTGLVKPSESFEPVFYRQKYPDIKDQHVVLGHYVKHGHGEGRLPIKRRLPKTITNEYEEMLDIEPKLLQAQGGLHSIVRYPRVKTSLFLPEIVKRKIDSEIKAIVCVPFISRGGADLVATYCLKVLQERYGLDAVLLIVTDSGNVDVESWLDDDTRYIVLEDETQFQNLEDKTKTLHDVIGQFTPDSILNVNSQACWEMYTQYGRQLSIVTNLYSYLFCYDYNSERNRVGYITDYLADTIGFLKAVIFDNVSIIDNIRENYRFCQSNMKKLYPVYSPYTGITSRYEDVSKKDGVLWIGRLAVQKRPDILIEISQALPSLTFYVYGTAGDSESSRSIIEGEHDNIEYMGTFTDIAEVELDNYALFLHNSEWEGIPTILITMMANSVPVVTSNVGGISELVSVETGWIVEDFESIDEYCENITKAMLDKKSTIKKAEVAYELIQKRHGWTAYLQALESVGIFSKTQLCKNDAFPDQGKQRSLVTN